MNRKQEVHFLNRRGWKCHAYDVHMVDTNGRDMFNVLKIYRWTHGTHVTYPLTRDEAVAAEQQYEKRFKAMERHHKRLFQC
jgi:hypothetical protein